MFYINKKTPRSKRYHFPTCMRLTTVCDPVLMYNLVGIVALLSVDISGKIKALFSAEKIKNI